MKNPFTAVRRFSGETIKELKKASWPSWNELKESTIVVLFATAILGVYITITDFSLHQVVNLLTGWVAR